MWTEKFQMYKLGFEVAEEPEIKLPEFIGLWKKQRSSTTPTSATDYTKLLTMWITANWKILKEMGVPDHFTCLLRNMYAHQEPTVTIRHGTNDWFKTVKGVQQSYILSPSLFNLYAEYIRQNAGLDEPQTGIKISRRNTNNLRYGDDTTQMAESEEELKSFCWRWKRRVKELAWNLTLKNLRSLHLVP